MALVGPSGAGKTTMFQLLLRFYDPQAGRGAIDGIDVRRADPRAVRGRIARGAAGPGDLRRQRLGEHRATAGPTRPKPRCAPPCERPTRPNSSSACRSGFDTFLGERGVRLSGGQRQRIAIARAMLRDRPLLLLDEATSALDAESERMVQLALERLMRGRTTLIIAHRLATVIGADRIVVLDGGASSRKARTRRWCARSALSPARGAAIRPRRRRGRCIGRRARSRRG